MIVLKNFIKKYTKLPLSEWEIIEQQFETKTIKKNEIIVEQGSICRHFFFLEKGLVRFFEYNNGVDVTKFFTVAPYCFTSKNSFRHQVPTKENIQALENCIVRQIKLKNSNELLKLDSWNTFTRKFVNEVQDHMEELLMEIRTQTAEQRYMNLQNKYPELVPQIPLKHLSTFLGITPQSLSRIRKKIVTS